MWEKEAPCASLNTTTVLLKKVASKACLGVLERECLRPGPIGAQMDH